MKNATVSVRLPEDMVERLGEADNASAVVREALKVYFAQLDGAPSTEDRLDRLSRRVKKIEQAISGLQRPNQ